MKAKLAVIAIGALVLMANESSARHQTMLFIRAAVAAKRDPAFFIIARTDSRECAASPRNSRLVWVLTKPLKIRGILRWALL
jgi:hypothetical protein